MHSRYIAKTQKLVVKYSTKIRSKVTYPYNKYKGKLVNLRTQKKYEAEENQMKNKYLKSNSSKSTTIAPDLGEDKDFKYPNSNIKFSESWILHKYISKILIINNKQMSKKELCEKHCDQNLSSVQLVKEYEISDSMVSDILKKSEYWLSIDSTLLNANKFCEKTCSYPQIEEAMSNWVDQQISRNLTLREAESAPISEISQMRVELQEILQEYELKDIWNCDETALFWHLLSCKTIAHSPVIGKKCFKDNDSKVEDDFEDLQLLINRLPITDLLNMKEYIDIDINLFTEEELLLEEIVNMVKE
ncbi:hypothetical protein C1645_813006 [Glomus cerebriforme]|uniref:HTH CENPB-type domain-containing protein n=1 Tax=Glomus cerebriforme TaxID=658196 RepID=A0A397TP76_9GLOM|nr:hypothetical protein C1645_813006 [Glomus cerebriforme]